MVTFMMKRPIPTLNSLTSPQIYAEVNTDITEYSRKKIKWDVRMKHYLNIRENTQKMVLY